jgi:hypothetical protein
MNDGHTTTVVSAGSSILEVSAFVLESLLVLQLPLVALVDAEREISNARGDGVLRDF